MYSPLSVFDYLTDIKTYSSFYMNVANTLETRNSNIGNDLRSFHENKYGAIEGKRIKWRGRVVMFNFSVHYCLVHTQTVHMHRYIEK